MRLLKAQNTNLRNITGRGVKYGSDDIVVVDTTKSMIIPKGGTADRPDQPVPGSVRYNTDEDKFEFYDGLEWEFVATESKLTEIVYKYIVAFTG
jgi:hypothetical protein